jgi:hypothetical protein
MIGRIFFQGGMSAPSKGGHGEEVKRPARARDAWRLYTLHMHESLRRGARRSGEEEAFVMFIEWRLLNGRETVIGDIG